MSTHLTEEEQLEKLKAWWKEHGKTIVLVIVFSVGGYFTWTGWQDQRQARAERASENYQQLLDTVREQPLHTLSDSQRSRAVELAETLKETAGNSHYAHSAALLLASLAVHDNDLDSAESELRWVLDRRLRPATESVAQLRLARVLAAKGSYAEALAMLEGVDARAFAAKRAEIRGDILLAQGDRNAARRAYEEALASLGGMPNQRQMILQMKLDDLRPPTDGENAS